MEGRKTAAAGLAGLGVLLSGLAHAGALGDDAWRASRQILRNVGLYQDAIFTVDDGLKAFRGLQTGDDMERAAAFAGCQAVNADGFGLTREELKAQIRAQLPEWVAAEPSGRVDDTVDKAATALTIGELNPRLGVVYVRYCGPA